MPHAGVTIYMIESVTPPTKDVKKQRFHIISHLKRLPEYTDCQKDGQNVLSEQIRLGAFTIKIKIHAVSATLE